MLETQGDQGKLGLPYCSQAIETKEIDMELMAVIPTVVSIAMFALCIKIYGAAIDALLWGIIPVWVTYAGIVLALLNHVIQL